MTDIRRKIDLYILSLGPLFVFFIVISLKVPDSFCFERVECWWLLVVSNPLSLVSVLALMYCAFAYAKFNSDLSGAGELPFKINKLKNINYEHLTFLATYVVPLISFDLNNRRQIVVLGLLLVVMGAIYIKTDLFYANPALALFGFHIYLASGEFKNGDRDDITLICRDRLRIDQRVVYIKLDDRIYYVRRIK